MKKYKIIYADPPFKYNQSMLSGSKPENHYDTMKFDDIANLKIQDVCDDDCGLFIWSSSSYIDGVIKIIKAWGFQYKIVAFVWVKKNKDFKTSKVPGF